MRIRASSSAMTTRRGTAGVGVLAAAGSVTTPRLVGYGFLAVGPGSPTAEAMLSNSIQCEFESHPGHLSTRVDDGPLAVRAVPQRHAWPRKCRSRTATGVSRTPYERCPAERRTSGAPAAFLAAKMPLTH